MASSKGVALVTGGARGIGRGIALRLADDGFDVAVSDLPGTADLTVVKKEIEAKGRRAHVFEGDVSKEQSVIELVDSVVGALGSLDVMVANAGIAHLKSILDISVEEFERVLAVNVRGVMLSYKYAAKQMIAQGRGGRIIGASSAVGVRGSGWSFAYSTSKFAVRGMTQAVAEDMGKHNITVNAYAPGAIDTDMYKYMESTLSKDFGVEVSGMLQHLPITRLGTPADVGHVVSFLASEHGGFVTGQTISVDGGVHFS
ncbi:acetoin reductase family protein [Auriscalpium vulgare]|uniref:Acetoin reductase family protein n=1 Tax=Auriscalpium vulgare TaxID=40419 RepID=A0ACB8S006_9AGAM|nr:acetoin reductase family protein [Auriscalpium vulgare]